MKGKHTQRIIELIAWSAFLGFPVILFPTFMPYTGDDTIHPALAGVLLTHGLLICFYYFNLYFAIPRFYFKRKFNSYMPVMLACLLFIILVLHLDRGFNPFPSPPFRYPDFIFFLSIALRFIIVFLFSLGIANIRRLEEIEKEKISTELSYLKSQLNPHFLFNTLNSIYALTVKKTDQAPEAVMKLSSIMRYVISDTATGYVDLAKEIDYIQSYIDLEKLRLTSRVRLHYEVDGDPAGLRVAPLIFVPLVENSFKHGVSTNEDSEIRIHISIRAGELILTVENTILRTKKEGTGLGLNNVRKRLNLLYPGKHELTIRQTDRMHTAILRLKLHD